MSIDKYTTALDCYKFLMLETESLGAIQCLDLRNKLSESISRRLEWVCEDPFNKSESVESSEHKKAIIEITENTICQPFEEVPTKRPPKNAERFWPFMRCKRVIKHVLYLVVNTGLSKPTSRLSHLEILNLLAGIGNISLEELLETNPITYLKKYTDYYFAIEKILGARVIRYLEAE